MKTIFGFTTLFLLSSLLSFSINNNDPKNLTKQKILDTSYKNLIKYDWFKTKKYVANDEYDNWLVCEYFYSKTEKIKVIYSDLKRIFPIAIETKMNLFQNNMKLSNGFSFKNIVLNKNTFLDLNDEGDFDIIEFDLKNKYKYYHTYKISCAREIELDIENIRSKLTHGKNKELPKSIQGCKLVLITIFRNFDSNGKLFREPF